MIRAAVCQTVKPASKRFQELEREREREREIEKGRTLTAFRSA